MTERRSGQSVTMATGKRFASPGSFIRTSSVHMHTERVYLIFMGILLQLLLVSVQGATGYNTTFVQKHINGECWQYVNHKGGQIVSHASSGRYADNTDCKVTVTADPGRRIRVVFESFDLTESINCYQDEVLVYDGQSFSSLMLSGAPYGLCGNELEQRYRVLETTGNEMTLRFITDNVRSRNKGFTAVYTTFVPEDTRTAKDRCFNCVDGSMCIDSSLTCDSLQNCPDGSDEALQLCSAPTTETPEPPNGSLTRMGTLVAITVIIFFVSVALFCCCCKNKNSAPTGGQPNSVRGQGIASSAPPSSISSSSNSSSTSSPNYSEMIPRRPQSGVQVFNMESERAPNSGHHMIYNYPTPNGRDRSGMYGCQSGAPVAAYYPMRRDNYAGYKTEQEYSSEQKYSMGPNGQCFIGMPTN